MWLWAFRARAVRPESLLALGATSRSLCGSTDFTGSLAGSTLRLSLLFKAPEDFIRSMTSASRSRACDIHTYIAARGFTIMAGKRAGALHGRTLLFAIVTASSSFTERQQGVCHSANTYPQFVLSLIVGNTVDRVTWEVSPVLPYRTFRSAPLLLSLA